jgi:Tfp pilus assembly protein PilV
MATAQRGTTLLETMVAMAVTLVAAVGTLSMNVQHLRMNGEARRVTEATAIARDLVENISTWPYGDARLANTQSGNDGDIADDAFKFERAVTSTDYDHAEADLTAGGASWTGLPTPAVAPKGFERYWNVAYPDDAESNSIPDAVRVAVIVRWQVGSGWRRVVLLTTKVNPGEAQ